MSRREFSRKIRKAAFDRAAGKCEKCKAALKLREGEVDHILPDALGGEAVLANSQVLCRICHAEKSADDLRRTRKADRQRDKATGALRSQQKIPGAPMPVSRDRAAKQARASNKLPLPARKNPMYREVQP